MTRRRRLCLWAILIGLAFGSDALATEFRWVATQIAPDRAIWQPSLVLIDNKTDLQDGLVFVLENPTPTLHVFAVHGLSALVSAAPPAGDTTAPLSVRVEPNETKRVRIHTRPLLGAGAEGRQFRVQCPIHTAGHLPGSIFVVGGSFRDIP